MMTQKSEIDSLPETTQIFTKMCTKKTTSIPDAERPDMMTHKSEIDSLPETTQFFTKMCAKVTTFQSQMRSDPT